MTTDTDRLEWVIAHKATASKGQRMMTRRGLLKLENLEPVWRLEWEQPNGDLIEQSPDQGHKTFREAIDAAMTAYPRG